MAVVPNIKTDRGREHLESYCQILTNLADDPQAIVILNRLKDSQQGDYATLKLISELVEGFKEKEVSDLRTVMHTTMAYYDDFEVLGEMIGIPEETRSPDTYARLLQYVTLQKRHQKSL